MAIYEVRFGVNGKTDQSYNFDANSESEAIAKWENSHFNNGMNSIGRVIRR